MKVCSECGARNADHNQLCAQCGAQLATPVDQSEKAYTGDTDQIPAQQAVSAQDLVAQASEVLAEGHTAEPIELCQRALALQPNYLAALALLGMAHEEAGNLQDALDAYESVLRIDPSRAAERQKASLLKLQILRGDQPAPEANEGDETWLRYAPLVLSVAAALLVFVVGALLIVSARNAHRLNDAEAGYEFAMEAGNAAMADGRYTKAASHFQAALQANPQDKAAARRLELARERLAEGESRTAQLPKYIPSKGPNPFAPVVIPATADEEEPPAIAEPLVPPPTPITRASTPPYREVSGGSRHPSATSSGTAGKSGSKATSGNEIISPRNETKTAKPTGSASTETATPPDRGPGEISIWISDKPPPATSTTKPEQPAPSPDELRAQADELRRQGRYGEAAARYGQAGKAYRQRMEDNPQLSAAAKASVDACKAGQEFCEAQE